jgi:hypothetical protein
MNTIIASGTVGVSGLYQWGSGLGIVATSGSVVSMISGPGPWSGGWTSGPESENQQINNQFNELYETLPKDAGDYMLNSVNYIDTALALAKNMREQGVWVKLVRVKDDMAAIYTSKWKKEEEFERGIPKFNMEEKT